MARSKLVKRNKARRRRRHTESGSSGPRRNPPLFTDLMSDILPGFGGYAATRFASRISTQVIAKKFPKLARHAGVLSSVAAFGAAWWGAHRVKMLAKYHTPIVVGSGLATIATFIQTYLPGLGWMISEVGAAEIAATTNGKQLAAGDDVIVDTTFEPNWNAYNDAYDAGRYQREVLPGQTLPQSAATGEPAAAEMSMEELLGDLDSDPSKVGAVGGIFGGN